MEIDEERVDQAVPALLQLGLHGGVRAWKTFDWDAMERMRLASRRGGRTARA